MDGQRLFELRHPHDTPSFSIRASARSQLVSSPSSNAMSFTCCGIMQSTPALVLITILLTALPDASSNVIRPDVGSPTEDFKCNSGIVIPAIFICDGEFDCGSQDKSDEMNCKYNQGVQQESSESLEDVKEIEEALLDLGPVLQQERMILFKIPEGEEEETTGDDMLHEDVASIGRSWFKKLVNRMD